MMVAPLRFSFGDSMAGVSANNQLAQMPIVLRHTSQSVIAVGLLDTGSTVNVLPFGLGLQLGFVWDDQTILPPLTGTLATVPARGVIVSDQVGSFAPVDLAFAWISTDAAPLLLGQINFFMEFDVCFFRSEGVFEVSPQRALYR
ncbi:MAG TPA: retroviral-like aspartic protease [Anaerolineae bacterium]|nr:retroviral-like aspartic protease [Anaerolineae bacterium]